MTRPRYVVGRSPCPYHEGLCAFYGDEPDRCPHCHATWSAIRARSDYEGTDEAHTARHEADRAYRRGRAAQRAETRHRGPESAG
jgi:hypothetical protein